MPRFRLAAPKQNEQDLVGQVADYLSTEQALGRVAWFCRVNGGSALIKGGFVRFYRLYLRGEKPVSKGKSDYEGQMMDGRYFAVELKAGDNKASKEQALFIDCVAKHGGLAGVAYRWEDVKEILFGEAND